MPAERKSTRLANRQAGPKVTIPDEYQSELWSSSSESEEVDDDEIVAVKKGSGAKRKPKSSSSTKQPPSKKPRGLKGLLKDVIDMPLDILYEIFGHVLPVDLLNLARTSKDLRKILMNRSSAFVWRNARASDPHGLPDCPSTISEPAYASLCYAKHCTCCYCATPSPYYIFSVRMRLCRRCVDQQFKSLPDPLSRHNLKAFKFLPKVEFPSQPLYRRFVYYTPAVEKLNTIFQRLTSTHREHAIWSAELHKHKFVKQLRRRHRHAIACAKWLKSRNDDIESQRISLLDSRRAEVMEYGKGLGWSEELLKFDGAIEAIKDCPSINRVCGKKITPQALEGIKEVLVELLEEIKLEHSVWKIQTALKQRLPLLNRIRQVCSRSFHPHIPVVSARELFHVPTIHSLIMDTPLEDFTTETLEPVRENFTVLMTEAQKLMKEALFKMIENAYGPGDAIDEHTIFNLATTFFKCKDCPYTTIRLPRALVHSCAIRFRGLSAKKAGLSLEENAEADVASKVLSESRWNEHNYLSFDKNMAAMTGDIVGLCGLDPKVATTDDMDLANPILECMSCNNIYNGRTTMNWTTTVHHYYSDHSSADIANVTHRPMLLKVVDEPEASYVRSQIKMLQEKAYSAQFAERCVCVKCHLSGNMPSLKAHWKAVHGRSPSEGDILPHLDVAFNLHEFMLWPPRDPDEPLTGGTEIKPPA